MRTYPAKSLFDLEIEETQKAQEAQSLAQAEQEAQKQILEKQFQEVKNQALQKIEKALSESDKKALQEAFEASTQSPFFSAMKKHQGGVQLLREDFLAKKYLPDHLQSSEKYLKHINFKPS